MSAVAERAPASSAPPRRPRSVARGTVRPSWGDRLEYLGLRMAAGVLGALPLWLALRIGELGALVAWLVDRPHRRVGMRNLALAFPERPLAARRRILRRSFLNLGRMAAELAHFPRLTPGRVASMVRFADEDHWRRTMGEERSTGRLVLSGHFGNWELLVFANGMRGYPVSLVHRGIANPLVDRWLNRLRARAGTRLIRKHDAARDVLRALRARELLVLPFDQNSTRGLGVFVDFFGVPASTNAGLARIALRTGAPVLPVFLVREGRSARHVAHLLPAVHVERRGDLEADVREATRRFSALFEEMVRRYPEQWLWMHKRWKTRPEGEPRLY
ncbi:MAG TPA: lysophospholipid acyltransferase family protein [Candidatus Binatia bacterium]|nr:lysophospholipid acyltransferase family protein [Candidatus Binatia bacterium]